MKAEFLEPGTFLVDFLMEKTHIFHSVIGNNSTKNRPVSPEKQRFQQDACDFFVDVFASIAGKLRHFCVKNEGPLNFDLNLVEYSPEN